MIGYLNDKDGYQVYVPYLKKTAHSHDVYCKSERVVETGLENTVVEDVVAENRQKDDTMSESAQSEKALEVKTEEEFSRNTRRPIRIVKRPVWMTSGDYILPLARTAIAGDGDPTSYWEAINSAQAEEWVTAMKEEMDALVENDM
jgi:hypothetical protein